MSPCFRRKNQRLFRIDRLAVGALSLGLVMAASAGAVPPNSAPWWKRMFVLPFAKVEKLVLRPPEAVQAKVPFESLAKEIPGRIGRVLEFAWIREWAEAKGVKVYLFGGTASAYAHYVHGDLLREAGDGRYQAAHYDYDYTNIFRSTQDLDIVLDGPPETARDLQEALQTKFAYLQGQKSQWEVRLLRESLGEKETLLDNPNFLNQHSDSNSTGLVEITRSADPPVRDLRDWKSGLRNQFLRDVHEFKLHYYWSALHRTTARARKGLNPPIISVIRALTKAFQYELELDEESIGRLQKEVNAFKAKQVGDSYVERWLHKNAPKMIQNAVNIEYAVETLNSLGLLDKLASIGNPEEVDSMAWWLRRKPLPTKVVGAGIGRTARDLGIDVVAHETKSFLTYESITKAHTGDPNVLTSRGDATGEAAVHGEGFYTRRGLQGARGTGITVHFRVDPEARLGHDFEIAGDYVIFKNKAAFKVIPESLNLTPLEFITRVEGGLVNIDERIDLALLEKFKRRIRPRISLASEADLAGIFSRLKAQLAKAKPDREALSLYLELFGADPKYDRMWSLLREKFGPGEFEFDLSNPWSQWLGDLRDGPMASAFKSPEAAALFKEFDRAKDLQLKKIFGSAIDFAQAIRQAAAPGSQSFTRFTDGKGPSMPLHHHDIWTKAAEHADEPFELLFLIESHPKEFFAFSLASDTWVRSPVSVEIFQAGMQVFSRNSIYSSEFLHGLGGWGNHPQALAILDYFLDHYLPLLHPPTRIAEMAAGKDIGGYRRALMRDLDYWLLERNREYIGSREFRKASTWPENPQLIELCKPARVNAECIMKHYFSGKKFSAEPLRDSCTGLLHP